MKAFCATVLTACLYLTAACSGASKKSPASEQNPPPNSGNPAPTTFTGLEASLFGPFCTGCHNASSHTAGIVLDNYAGAMASVTPDDHQQIVIANDSADSPLFQTVSAGDMPPSGSKPSPDLVQALKDWIDAGAKLAQ